MQKENNKNNEKIDVNISTDFSNSNAAKLGSKYANLTNSSLEQRYDEILESEASQETDMQALAEKMFKLYAKAFENWHSEKHELLNDEDLATYLSRLSSDDLLDFTFAFVKKSDFDLPEQLIQCLKELDTDARDRVLQELLETSIEAKSFSSVDEEIAIRYGTARLLNILADWNDPKYSKDILNWLLDSKNPDERLQDDVVEYFERCSEHSFDLIKEALLNELESSEAKANKELNSVADTLILTITKIGKKHDNYKDEAYKTLRKVFKEVKDKTLVVMNLGDLGSARAIPLLRSYIEEHYDEMPEELYADFYVAIKKLGGNTEDLPTISKQGWNWEF